MGSKFSKSALIYTPLNKKRPQIRLLRFNRPFCGDKQIKLTLFEAWLDSNPNFVALSYEWGDASNVEDILINGKPLPVTCNLVSALKQMGSQFSDQTLWVDAICINQADVEEKNYQVTLMRRIYQQAAGVFSWLGESDEESRRAVKLLRNLTHIWNNRIGCKFEDIPKQLDFKGMNGLDDVWQELHAGIHSLNALFSRSYWERVWILQETMLARVLICVCGPDVFTYEQIRMASTIVYMASRTPGLFKVDTRYFLMTSPILNADRRISSSMRTVVLFLFARSSRATDPRDYIYGLIGLIDFEIQPDYSMAVRDVYCSFARSWITQTLRLDVLKFAGKALTIENGRTEGVPTWVPDWHALTKCYQEPCSSKFNASGEMPAKARFSTDLGTMWLNGMCCDEITFIVPNMVDTGNNLKDLSDYYWSVVLNPDGVNGYSESTTRVEATFWLLFQDEYDELRRNLDKLRRYVFIYSTILSATKATEVLVAQLPHDEFDWKIEEFCKDKAGDLIRLKAVLGLCMRFGKSIFGDLDDVLPLLNEMTQKGSVDFETDVDTSRILTGCNFRGTYTVAFHTLQGHVGMLRHWLPNERSDNVSAARGRPSNVILPGDVVCVLAGYDYPVVLRRKDSHFVFIGVCSVIGLMEGEVMELMRAGKVKGEVLEIR